MKGASLYRQAVRGLRTSAVRPGTAQAGPSRLWTGAAIAVTIGTLWTVYPSMKSYRAVLNDAAPAVDYRIAQDDKNGVKIDPDTQIAFPIRLPLSSSGPSLSLVGLGVRKVSFLRVKVYSAGFYLEEGLQGRLSDIPGWQGFVAARLLASATSKGSSNDSSQLEGEALMANLLNEDIACAVRIVPTRNTDFAHLRDGFTRAIQARQKIARSAKSLSEADEEQISQSTQALKTLFPAQSVPKGKALTLLRTGQGDLVVEYEGKTLGTVKDNWVSKELMLAYFSDKDVISQKLKEDVAAGLESISRR